MSFAVADSSSASPTTSTFLHSGTLVLSKSLRETHAPQQVLETRVGTQSVIPKVGVNRPQCVLVPLNPLFQPVHGELLNWAKIRCFFGFSYHDWMRDVLILILLFDCH